YLRAATLASWPDAAPDDVLDVAPAATPWPVDAQRIAWLVAGPLPASLEHWIDAGGDVLLSSSVELVLPKDEITIAWRDEDGSALVEVAGKGRGRVSRFLRPLRPTDMPQLLSADFPMRLQLLFDTAPAPTRAWAQSQAPLSGAASVQPAPRDLRPWLAL